MVKLPLVLDYFPLLLYPFYWLFLLCFYFFYIPVYLAFWLFTPIRINDWPFVFYMAKFPRKERKLEKEKPKDQGKDEKK